MVNVNWGMLGGKPSFSNYPFIKPQQYNKGNTSQELMYSSMSRGYQDTASKEGTYWSKSINGDLSDVSKKSGIGRSREAGHLTKYSGDKLDFVAFKPGSAENTRGIHLAKAVLNKEIIQGQMQRSSDGSLVARDDKTGMTVVKKPNGEYWIKPSDAKESWGVYTPLNIQV